MDGLSSASAVLAVVSVACELVKAVHKLNLFLKDVKNAPKDVLEHLEELEIISAVVETTGKRIPTENCDEASQNVLKTCKNKINGLKKKIQATIDGLESRSLSRRKRAAFSFALDKDEVNGLQDTIERAKSTLSLVLANFTQ